MRWVALLTIFVSLLFSGAAAASPADALRVCTGRFVNPITAPCWDCIFPLTIGSVPIWRGKGVRIDAPNPPSPICACGTPIPRIGLTIGYWEPSRLMDVTQKPFCFPNLGGLSISPGFGYAGKSEYRHQSGAARTAYHAHYYVYPLLAWLQILTDFVCMESSGFDIAYMTEFDPLWNSDELSAIINPEVFLFANPIAQLACSADCVAATTVGRPIQKLFWCAGCQGSLYPMTGQVAGDYGPLTGSLHVAEKFQAKLHRELLAWGTRGSLSLCQPIPQPTMDKLQYRFQLVTPVAHKNLFSCTAIGKSTVPYEHLKVIPVKGEDIGYLVWKKRNCCAL
ncbi:TraU family protein [Asticcacaulis sp. BYS171W]|uniref:TraU family protein n=1 Tax=Asticcacaulis aquaticus TaxID=2984212 RepID=A0ABT5HWG3_9CAUL|nr:conjugal transfer pilus assembly protein TraU [Asticcacaulis aquaticus]MDC7684416.1 TraU family protein [Asticcacaulis aquaticus]